MTRGKTNIFVYAHWAGMPLPELIGKLCVQQGKGKSVFSFEYDAGWLKQIPTVRSAMMIICSQFLPLPRLASCRGSLLWLNRKEDRKSGRALSHLSYAAIRPCEWRAHTFRLRHDNDREY